MKFKIKEIHDKNSEVFSGARNSEWGSYIKVKQGKLISYHSNGSHAWAIAKVEGENSDLIPFTKEMKNQLIGVLDAF